MVVCADCGVVLEADPLVDNTIAEADDRRRLWTELSSSQLVVLTDDAHHRNRILHELIRALAAKFALPETIPLQAIHLVDEAVRSQLVNRGRTGRRAVAILLYLLCRVGEAPVPLTLSRIAGLCGENPTDLFPLLPPLQALMRQVRGSLPNHPRNDHPSLHLEPLLSRLGLAPEASIQALLPLATGLAQFCEERSLVEGRKVEAIALACIIVAAEAIGVVVPLKPRTQKEFIQHCCQTVDLKSPTVTQRIDEIKEALLQEAQANPLLAESIGCKFKKSSISLLASDILRHRALGASPTSPSVPIAFATSQAKTAARSAQIQRALARIAHPEAVSPEELARLEIDDLIIERLLLHNISPDRIGEASNTGHLCSLEDSIALEWDSDDEGEEVLPTGESETGRGGNTGSSDAHDDGSAKTRKVSSDQDGSSYK